MQQYIVNKTIIRDFYRRAVAQGDIEFANQVVADDYIQHSPMVKPGKAGLIEALQYMKQMPKPENPSKPFMRLIAEGDFVVTNLCFSWAGKQKVVVDLFRFEEGKIAEHWDAVQDQPETTQNGNLMMDGPIDIEDAALTQVNKKVVKDFFQDVFVNQQLETLSTYVSPDLIQHYPEINNGIDGLKSYMREAASKLSIHKIHHVIGEGNFAIVQSEGQTDFKAYMCYDVFRLSKGKIVEQWRVIQITP